MKNQKGITLVALVVTIVVLLILAGITIMYVLSDDGIFSSAKESRIESEKGSLMDYASQAQATYMVEYYRSEAMGTTAKGAKACVEDNIPVDESKGPFKSAVFTDNTSTPSAKGELNGSLEVEGKYANYTITFTKGVITATSSAKSST